MDYIKNKFFCVDDRDSGKTYDGYSFYRCEFDACQFSISSAPEFRVRAKNCHLKDCIVRGNCGIYTPIIEDSVVDGLKTPGTLFLRGAVFKHVVLKGKVGSIYVGRPAVSDGGSEEAFEVANRDYYATVDWALDLTQVEAQLDLELPSVPGHLIRRDPTTQILVTRERVLAADWRKIDLDGTPYDIALDRLAREGYDSRVLVAPSGHRSFSMHLKAQ
ncbi:hypothetical protein L6V77_35445, partial [Myxococcota bacterium]|nr:hypothetical protein [Myxococcota bacterium]